MLTLTKHRNDTCIYREKFTENESVETIIKH